MKFATWMTAIVTGMMGIGLVVGTATVEAAVLTYDGFDYPVGETLDGKDGGIGWDGVTWGEFLGGAGGLDIVAGNLTDPTGTLQRSGNHVQTNSQQFSGRYPLLPGYGDDGTTTFYSILLRPDADSDPGADDWYGLQLFSNAGLGDLFIGKGGAMTNYGFENTTLFIDDQSSVTPTLGETVLLVVRADFTFADDTFSLYINPTPGGPEPAVADATMFFDLGTQNGLAMNTGGGAQVSFDEIRIGETFADVTPLIASPIPAFVIDRDTGEIRIENQSPFNFNLVDYSITSAAGGLDAEGWQSIAENGDADSGAGFDPTGIWNETAATANELAEGTAGSGGQLAATTGSWSLGPAWLQSPFEDLQVMYELGDGSTGVADVSFDGNGGVPFGRSDLNADGTVNVDDWVIFLANSDTVFADVTSVQAYLQGDLDGDFDNDFRDFRLFKSDFIAENGAASFSALFGVPEPATVSLLAAGLAGLALCRRRRGLTSVAAALAIVMVCTVTSGVVMAADPALYVAADFPPNDPELYATDGTLVWTVTTSATGGAGSFFGFDDSWVLFSYPIDDVVGTAQADHTFFGGPLDVGQAVRLDWANSAVALGAPVGVSLTSGDTPVVTFKFVGEDPDGVYRYDDDSGIDQSTGEPFAYQTLASLEFWLNSGNSYTAAYGLSSWNGTYNGSIDGIRVFNDMGGDGSDVIFNNLEIGPTTLVPLSLEVSKSTGDVTIKGNATLAADIDYYQISSAAAALDPELWNSLDEQEGDAPGEGWDASPNADSNRLTEYFLGDSGSTLTAGSELSLGQAYDTTVFGAADGDLEFVYGIAGGAQLTGTVSYTGFLAADFDEDGDVDGDDFLAWQGGFGTPTGAQKSDGDYDNDGDVDGDDFLGWQSQFGSADGSASAAVPEPASGVLLLLALIGVAFLARRLRNDLFNQTASGGR